MLHNFHNGTFANKILYPFCAFLWFIFLDYVEPWLAYGALEWVDFQVANICIFYIVT